MPRVVHFEICADHPERAVEFYQSVFGWEIRRWDGPLEYWLIITGQDEEPGINGGLVHRDSSVAGPTNIIDVPSLDTALLRIEGTRVQSRGGGSAGRGGGRRGVFGESHRWHHHGGDDGNDKRQEKPLSP